MSFSKWILVVSALAAIGGWSWGAGILGRATEPAGPVQVARAPAPTAVHGVPWSPAPLERSFWKPPGSTAEPPQLVLQPRYWTPSTQSLAACESNETAASC